MTLAALIEEAKGASPKAEDSPHKWARLWPVYEPLRKRGFTCRQAVNWLVEKKQIAAKDADKARFAFHAQATRKNRRTKSRS